MIPIHTEDCSVQGAPSFRETPERAVQLLARGFRENVWARQHPPKVPILVDAGLTLYLAPWYVNRIIPDYAIKNFKEIADVGSTPSVNVVVELGRPKTSLGWSGVLRFHMTQGAKPEPAYAITDWKAKPDVKGSASPVELDMASPTTLADFVDWTLQYYKAKHYMLVIWNHGQGWRFQAATSAELKAASKTQEVLSDFVEQGGDVKSYAELLDSSSPIGGFRSVSVDDDTGGVLFNNQIEKVLADRFAVGKRPSDPQKPCDPKKKECSLDVLGFDACLMSMIETAYAFRKSVDIMVGSEELEPAEGWDYREFLTNLTKTPSMNAEQVGKAAVDAYKKRYVNPNDLVTQSSVRVQSIQSVASSISDLATLMRADINNERNFIRLARINSKTYGTRYNFKTSIDLAAFLSKYKSTTKNPDIKLAIDTVLQDIKGSVAANWASPYFPASAADVVMEPVDHSGYQKGNSLFPVDFVRNEYWADFIADYLR